VQQTASRHSITQNHTLHSITQHLKAPHSTTQHHKASYVASHSITQHHTASRSTTQHHTAHHIHHTAPHSTTEHHTALHSTTQHHRAQNSITHHLVYNCVCSVLHAVGFEKNLLRFGCYRVMYTCTTHIKQRTADCTSQTSNAPSVVFMMTGMCGVGSVSSRAVINSCTTISSHISH
jgi:hypothetical protein